jgi:hypothetical protein
MATRAGDGAASASSQLGQYACLLQQWDQLQANEQYSYATDMPPSCSARCQRCYNLLQLRNFNPQIATHVSQ